MDVERGLTLQRRLCTAGGRSQTELLSQHLVLLHTSFRNPFTDAGFGNWFRERCNEAELRHCTAYGLRKAAASRLSEAGASHEQIKSVTGHVTDQEASKYTAKANKRRLAAQAQQLLKDSHRGEKGTKNCRTSKIGSAKPSVTH